MWIIHNNVTYTLVESVLGAVTIMKEVVGFVYMLVLKIDLRIDKFGRKTCENVYNPTTNGRCGES